MDGIFYAVVLNLSATKNMVKNHEKARVAAISHTVMSSFLGAKD